MTTIDNQPIRGRVETTVQIVIVLAVGGMAGAASFTHVHDWTMTHTPYGTPGWFGWANAVISELTPIAAGLEIRRRKHHGQSIAYPMTVLIAAVTLSLAAQFAQAKPSISGWLLAAVPAVAFMALAKLTLASPSASPDPIRDAVATGAAGVMERFPEIAPKPAPAVPSAMVPVPAETLARFNARPNGVSTQ